VEITVHSPRLWWRATPDLLARLVPQDPDEQDHREPRHTDRHDRDWVSIAQTVDAVGEKLAAMRWDPFEHSHGPKFVTVTVDPLPEEDAEIVRQWFAGSPPNADPWHAYDNHPGVVDGRHRIWNTTPYGWDTTPHGAAVLRPIRSSCLGGGSAEELAEFPDFMQFAKNDLERLESVPGFDKSDPVNKEFVRALKAMSRGIPVT